MHDRRSMLSLEEWELILPGVCPLRRKVLPYLQRLQGLYAAGRTFDDAKCTFVTGIEDYDVFRLVQARLILLMLSSLRTEDGFWLTDEKLLEVLRRLEDLKPYTRDGGEWRWSCGAVVAEVKATVQEAAVRLPMSRCGKSSCLSSGGHSYLYHMFEPTVVEEEKGVTDSVASMVDETSLEMLKDVFYVVTGRGMWGDRNEVNGIPVSKNEWLGWRCVFPTRGSVECLNGTCSHLTGLVPVVGELAE